MTGGSGIPHPPGYKIERLIGEGGMASVFLAEQVSLGRPVALKALRKFDQPEQAQRFVNEGRIIAALNHRNIITIYDIGAWDGRHYIAMEYLTGGDLRKHIGDGMPIDTVLDLMETLARCLDFIHRQGIVHRDIKPENILFRDEQTPVLTDFGIAKKLQTDGALTMDGTALGSPHYLSPEQARGEVLDGRSDLYSLGIMFYEMLTGQKPFAAGSAVDSIVAHLTAPIPPLPRAVERYQDLLEGLTAKEPHDRFSDAAEMIECLGHLRVSGPVDKAARLWRRWKEPTLGPTAAPRRAPEEQKAPSDTGTKTLLLDVSGPPAPSTEPADAKRFSTAGYLGIAVLILTGLPATFWIFSRGPVGEAPVAEEVAARPQASSAETQVQMARLQQEIEEELQRRQTEEARHRRQAIEDLLNKAESARAALRLTTPPGDNAYYFYTRVLELEADNPEALSGMSAVADTYADMAQAALDRFHYTNARSYLSRGLSVQPDHPRLLALQKNTNAFRDAPKRMFRKLRSFFD